MFTILVFEYFLLNYLLCLLAARLFWTNYNKTQNQSDPRFLSALKGADSSDTDSKTALGPSILILDLRPHNFRFNCHSVVYQVQ